MLDTLVVLRCCRLGTSDYLFLLHLGKIHDGHGHVAGWSEHDKESVSEDEQAMTWPCKSGIDGKLAT